MKNLKKIIIGLMLTMVMCLGISGIAMAHDDIHIGMWVNTPNCPGWTFNITACQVLQEKISTSTDPVVALQKGLSNAANFANVSKGGNIWNVSTSSPLVINLNGSNPNTSWGHFLMDAGDFMDNCSVVIMGNYVNTATGQTYPATIQITVIDPAVGKCGASVFENSGGLNMAAFHDGGGSQYDIQLELSNPPNS